MKPFGTTDEVKERETYVRKIFSVNDTDKVEITDEKPDLASALYLAFVYAESDTHTQ
jgi:hypothetical protein